MAAIVLAVCLAGCPPGEKASSLVGVSPWSIDLANESVEGVVTISAASPDGAGKRFSVESSAPWLTAAPETGVVPAEGAHTSIALRATRALMKPGANQGTVAVAVDRVERHVITVRAEATLVADFTASQTVVTANDPVSFSDASTILTGAAPISHWHWEFGDGTTSDEQNPVHAYTDRGRYTVQLEVRSSDHADLRRRQGFIHVSEPQGPMADFVAATTRPVAGVPVQFTSTALPGTAPITSWLWDFGDGNQSAVPNPVHVYAAASVYDVYLTVTTRLSSDTEIKLGYIDVREAPPVAEFATRHRTPFAGEPLEFTDFSASPGGPIVRWLWDFGDGTQSMESNPTHVYTAAEVYSVSLTVESPGGSDSERKHDYVVVQPRPREVPFRVIIP